MTAGKPCAVQRCTATEGATQILPPATYRTDTSKRPYRRSRPGWRRHTSTSFVGPKSRNLRARSLNVPCGTVGNCYTPSGTRRYAAARSFPACRSRTTGRPSQILAPCRRKIVRRRVGVRFCPDCVQQVTACHNKAGSLKRGISCGNAPCACCTVYAKELARLRQASATRPSSASIPPGCIRFLFGLPVAWHATHNQEALLPSNAA